MAQSVLSAAPVILYVYDVQKDRSVFQNRHFGELLGYRNAKEFSGDWRLSIHPDDAFAAEEHLRRLKKIAPGETLQWNFRMRAANGELRWFTSRDVLMSADDRGRPLLIVGTAGDITQQKRAEELKDLMTGEMRHRAKNLAAVVDAIARQSRPKNDPAAAAYMDTFLGRLMTLLNTGDMVLASVTRTVDLGAVLDLALRPFVQNDLPHRFTLNGPPVNLSEHTGGGLALATHELATNAVKYGALSVPQGRVAVSWSVTPLVDGERIVLDWLESGGPRVSAPEGVGFGTRVVKQSIAHEPNADVKLDYRPDGLHCRFAFEPAHH